MVQMVRPSRRSNHLSGFLPAMLFHQSVWLIFSVFGHVVTSHDSVKVNTKYGVLIGLRTLGKYNQAGGVPFSGLDRFLGTPYATPPVGERRFQPPQEPLPWDGARNATSFGSVCPQIVFHEDTAIENQSEDCLFLDIYSPFDDAHPHKKYPVLIFIHGGSYEVGSGRLYDGSVLAQYGVVVVSVSYRLGALGFMTSGDSHITGNNGLLDQIEAMRWVKDNIRDFRGDPDLVTIMGHSVGAASVGLLLIMPQTKDLFHRVIAMSGSATALYSDGYPPDTDHHEYVRQVSELFGCSRDADFKTVVQCLRRVPPQSFIEKRDMFPRYDPIDPEFKPFIDGNYITDRPRNLFVKGKFHKVPVLTGTVTDEFGNYFNGGARHAPPFDDALDKHLLRFVGSEQLAWIARHFYTDWQQTPRPVYDRGDLLSDLHMVAPTTDISDLISGHSAPPVYQYHIDLKPSYHSVELNYLFGTPFSGRFVDEMSESGQGDMSKFTEADKAFSRRIMQLWSSFATDGNPIEDGIATTWQAFQGSCRNYAYLTPSQNTTMKNNLRASEVAFWNQIIPKLKGENGFIELKHSEQPKWTVNMWILIVVVIVLLALLLLATVLYVKLSLRVHRRQNGYSKPRPAKV